MHTPVRWLILVAASYAPFALGQPVVWNESSAASIRMLPDAPDSRTLIAFELVKTCEPLDLGRVEYSGFDVRVELWGSDYCADIDLPRTQSKELGVLRSGRYTVGFYYCADLPAPDSYQCFHVESQEFSVGEPIVRPIPFAAPATLLFLPTLLLLVASGMLRRR